MARCEDFPCCGHEPGCCPDYDESGRQLNMKCVCGATVPLGSRSSLCASCLRDPEDPYFDEDQYFEDGDYEYEDDGQPSEYEEWQDVYGGDVEEYGTFGDYDHGD